MKCNNEDLHVAKLFPNLYQKKCPIHVFIRLSSHLCLEILDHHDDLDSIYTSLRRIHQSTDEMRARDGCCGGAPLLLWWGDLWSGRRAPKRGKQNRPQGRVRPHGRKLKRTGKTQHRKQMPRMQAGSRPLALLVLQICWRCVRGCACVRG